MKTEHTVDLIADWGDNVVSLRQRHEPPNLGIVVRHAEAKRLGIFKPDPVFKTGDIIQCEGCARIVTEVCSDGCHSTTPAGRPVGFVTWDAYKFWKKIGTAS